MFDFAHQFRDTALKAASFNMKTQGLFNHEFACCWVSVTAPMSRTVIIPERYILVAASILDKLYQEQAGRCITRMPLHVQRWGSLLFKSN